MLFCFTYMPARKRLSKSRRKFIRKEKARIRREILDLEKQEAEIEKLYLHNKDKGKQKK